MRHGPVIDGIPVIEGCHGSNRNNRYLGPYWDVLAARFRRPNPPVVTRTNALIPSASHFRPILGPVTA
jgi:hypothetical protein